MTDARAVLDRLRRVRWLDEDAMYDHERSRVALMREYLRRAALWADAYAAEDVWPFFDIGARVDPTVRADADVVADLEALLDAEVGRLSVKITCRGAVHWAALLAERGTELPDLPDPYEPLLMMYERGGIFTVESEFIDLTAGMIPFPKMRDCIAENPVVALDPAVLDSLDG